MTSQVLNFSRQTQLHHYHGDAAGQLIPASLVSSNNTEERPNSLEGDGRYRISRGT